MKRLFLIAALLMPVHPTQAEEVPKPTINQQDNSYGRGERFMLLLVLGMCGSMLFGVLCETQTFYAYPLAGEPDPEDE